MHETIPTGTVTLLLADLEGSVRLWEQDAGAMAAAVARADELITDAARDHQGVRPVEQGEGDSFVLAFARPSDALACALEIQRATAKEPWPAGLVLRYRIALHTGEVELRDEGNYAGGSVNRCARIRDLGHGGQTLVSQSTRDLAVDALPADADLEDLGTHALRDLERPERLYQLVHPDLGFGSVDPRVGGLGTGALPVSATAFIGRSIELSEVSRLLAETRLLTLTGAGGSGKTRLAIEAASLDAVRPLGGARWVDLASLSAPELVVPAVATAVGLRPPSGRDPLRSVVEALADQSLLVVLDNCEHLVDACATLADEVLRTCPTITFLATSREPLGVDGETTYRVPSLPVPDDAATNPSELASTDAVRLFVDRARHTRPGFTLTRDNAAAVAEICRRLDGIPLALELAAARTRMLSPTQIADGLANRFTLLTGGARRALARQRTLEASVAWSYDLLNPEEQRVLARLSVFAGSFGLEAAEAVATGDHVAPGSVLDVLTALVDRSLVQVDDHGENRRYRLLETIRVYGRDRLGELEDPGAVRERHLAYYVEVATTAGAALAGADADRWLARLGAELDDLRAAMDWAAAAGRPFDVVAVVVPLSSYWMVRGLFTEIRRRLDDAVRSPRVPLEVRGQAMTAASIHALMGGDFAGGFALAEDALTAAREGDDVLNEGRAALFRAWSGFLSGKGSDAQIWPDLEHSEELLREHGPPEEVGRVALYAGVLRASAGHLVEGRRLLDRAIEIADRNGLPHLAAPSHAFASGPWLLGTGLLDEAESHANEAIRLGRDLGYHAFVSHALGALGTIAVLRGDENRARRVLGEARAVARDAGLDGFEMTAMHLLAQCEYRFGDTETAVPIATEALEAARASTSRLWELLCEWLLGVLAHHHGDPETARAHFERARDGSLDPRYPRVLGRAQLGLATLAEGDGRILDAWYETHDALEVLGADDASDSDDSIEIYPLEVLETLEVLAGLAARTERPEQAARLLGAVERMREENGVGRFPHERARHRETVAHVQELLGAEEAERHRSAGMAMSAHAAVAYARRGRGERARPTTGWQSLTPAELDVASLVTEGCTNGEVAERLFVSVNTVKTHLSHIYAKLGIAGRAELGAEVARRGA